MTTNHDAVNNFLTRVKCEFRTNTPSASHMGGVWERQIRTARGVLAGILERNKCRLSTATLRTLLYEVMAIINSRPLAVEGLYSDPTLVPICPNDLLTMKSKFYKLRCLKKRYKLKPLKSLPKMSKRLKKTLIY